MALDRYQGPGSILMGGSLLAEAQNVRVQVSSNNNRVRTMKKGLAGRSKGPREAEISVGNAVPIAGLEQEYVQMIAEDADVQIVIPFGGRRYQYDGWIDSVSHSDDTDSASTIEFTVIAGPPRIL